MTGPCRPTPTSPRPRDDVTWTKSSFCAHGDCLEALRAGRVVLVRNSTNPGRVQAWSRREWAELVGIVAADCTHMAVDENLETGNVLLGLYRHLDDGGLHFTAEEWSAFVKGAQAGEFDFDRLALWADQTATEGVEAGACSGSVPAIEAKGAGGRTAVPPVPVAAQSSAAGPAECPGVASSPGAVTGDGESAAAVPSPVAAFCGPNGGPIDVPAGRSRSGSPVPVTPQVADRPGPTVLERTYEILLKQMYAPIIRTAQEEAAAIVQELHDAGLLVDEPLVDADELLKHEARPLVPVAPGDGPRGCACERCASGVRDA